MTGRAAGPDVLVIGAGILGSSAAYHLATAGARVTIVDRARPGSGTSASSFAWVNAQDKQPESYFRLNAEGLRAYPELAATLGGDWLHRGGDLVVGRGAGADKVAERIARHRDRGYPVTELDRDGVLALEPGLVLGDDPVVGAHFHEELWVDVPPFVDALLAAAVERGAEVVRDEVQAVDVRDGQVGAVRCASGRELQATTVLVAAGPRTEALLAGAGVRVPMAPSPGLLIRTGAVGDVVGRMIHAGDVSLRPDRDGTVLVASREVDATLPPETRAMGADDAPVRDVLERAARLIPALADARAEDVRIGIRSVATDGQPVVGAPPGLPGLYLLVSHSGVTLAPVLGRLVAREILGEPQEALVPYRPARFAEGAAGPEAS